MPPLSKMLLWITVLLLGAVAFGACTASDRGEGLNVDSEALTIHTNNSEPAANLSLPQSPKQEQFLVIEEIVVAMLLVAILVGVAARRLRVPYTVGLVIIGLIVTLVGRVNVEISPNLILALLVPPLIFEAAFHLNIGELRKDVSPILLLAVLGVSITMVVVGAIVHWGTGLALTSALVFGALVSATDPVSVVALFRSMGVPKRLQVLLEGESLFNDGTAIVAFDLVLALALAGMSNFQLLNGLGDFVRVVGGGLVVGLILGWIASQVIARIDDYLIETALTCVLAYGSYLIAEHFLGVSGVLAVVAAGLVNGNIGPRGMSPTTRIVVINFWEFAAFLANSFIFLLIGLGINLQDLTHAGALVAWAVAAALIARAVSVYGISRLAGKIPFKWQHVLFWGGLRGAISLALALSLPAALANANEIRLMAFGVVLFTLLVQGFSMEPLVRRLGLVERSAAQDEYEQAHARAVAGRAAYDHLERRYHQGLLSDHNWKIIAPYLAENNRQLAEAVRQVAIDEPAVEAEELDTAHREALRAQRSVLSRLRRDGVISEGNYTALVSEIDADLTEGEAGWSKLISSQRLSRMKVDCLMAVIVQRADVENASRALTQSGFMVTRLPSQGAFLQQPNATLLVGMAYGQEKEAVETLIASCRRQVTYPAPPVKGLPAVGKPTEIEIGGATIFTFPVERFEVF